MEFSPYTILNDSYIKGIYHFANFIQKRLCVFNKFNTYCSLVVFVVFAASTVSTLNVYNGFREFAKALFVFEATETLYKSCWERQQDWYNEQEMNIEAILCEGKSLIFRAFQAFSGLGFPASDAYVFCTFSGTQKVQLSVILCSYFRNLTKNRS